MTHNLFVCQGESEQVEHSRKRDQQTQRCGDEEEHGILTEISPGELRMQTEERSKGGAAYGRESKSGGVLLHFNAPLGGIKEVT